MFLDDKDERPLSGSARWSRLAGLLEVAFLPVFLKLRHLIINNSFVLVRGISQTRMARIFIGISAWADQGLLKSGFYPPEAKTPADRLKFYSSIFSLAEIDSTYHSFATARNIAAWLDNTPESFVFNFKAFSLFTLHPTPYQSLPRNFRDTYGDRIEAKASIYAHHLPEEALDDLWQGFERTARTFSAAGKLGALLFQFPPWFHPSPENYEHIASCRKRLPGLPLAVEFRTGSWLNEEHREKTVGLLKESGMTLVCVDEPQGLKSSVPPLVEVTAPLAIVRFHGRNKENWERKGALPDGKFDYLYQSGELLEWVPRIKAMASQAETLQVIFKNKFADYPVRNALEMKSLLGIP